MDTIRNPVEWGWAQLKGVGRAADTAVHRIADMEGEGYAPAPAVRKIGLGDLKEVLVRGLADLGAYRTDVVFLAIVYPFIGLILARFTFGQDLLPLLFPLASGFALVGPVAAVGLYELSRRREQGSEVTWKDAFGVLHSPSLVPIVLFALLLLGIFLVWMGAAYSIYAFTLGPDSAKSMETFLRAVFTTDAGWALIVVGCGVGFLFAVLVLMLSVVSLPLMLDKRIRFGTAVMTSVRAVLANPVPMAAWGLIVAVALILGTIPFFIGLIIVVPVLGHATWHLYRKVVVA